MPKLKAGIALFHGLRRVSWDTRHPPKGVCRRFERGDAQTSYKEKPYFQVLAGGEPVGKPPFWGASASGYQVAHLVAADSTPSLPTRCPGISNAVVVSGFSSRLSTKGLS